MFICTNPIQNANRITRNMQERKVTQDSYNCPNWTKTVKIIVGGWVVYFFPDTV